MVADPHYDVSGTLLQDEDGRPLRERVLPLPQQALRRFSTRLREVVLHVEDEDGSGGFFDWRGEFGKFKDRQLFTLGLRLHL